MVTPLQKNQIKKSDKGKKPMNQDKEKEKQQADASQIKHNDPNMLENIVTVSDQTENSNRNQEEPEKLTKQNQTFSLLKELEKVKIQVPLLELVKTLGYKKEIVEFINLSQSDEVGDIVNL